ncbi:MAG: carboxypeptidase-like regulatory domain-containing protein [Cyclobacteriaceae bacterium]
MRKIYWIVCIVLISASAFAQNGSITGKITDYKTKEGLIGANVVIQGTSVGAATDLDGGYTIANLKPGTYTLSISSVTYKTQTVADVVVESGKITTIEATLVEDVAELAEVVVTATREVNNDVSLMQGIRESKLVVSGISAEQIVRMPDRDAAQVMQRVSGVTITDNRFVVVRGMPERYNQVLINGAVGPSTEVDKRSFSFDLIPAGALDQLLIYKSATPELPGDAAGGIIQMVTKNPTDENYINFGMNVGIRQGTTFGDYAQSKGSSTDQFGFDNGDRSLPENFPTTTTLVSSQRNSSLREQAGKTLANNFDFTKTPTPVDWGANFTISEGFRIGKVQARNITSLSYSNSYQYYQAQFLRYNEILDTNSPKRFDYNDDFYSNNVKVSGMHNWLFKLSPKSKLEFKNLFVQIGQNETILRNGDDFIQRPSDNLRNYAYHYLSRSIYSGQLQGFHELGAAGKTKVNWVLGMSYIDRNEPDFRRFRTFRPKSAPEATPFNMQLPSAASPFESGRFWSGLKDKGFSNGVNFERILGDPKEKRKGSLKAGYYVDYKERTFSARFLNYLYPGNFDQTIGQQLIQQPLSTIFSPQNIKRIDGFVIEEGTQARDSYSGTGLVGAGYLSGTIPIGKWDLSAGVRGESFNQTLKGSDGVSPINVDNSVLSILPSLNTALNISDRALLRVAYSRTVNRPEFREIAPFLFYAFEYEAAIIGNPKLKIADVDNFDLRYEMYPNPGETFSVGAFYKYISNPIEIFLQRTAENPQLTYNNAKQAINWGFELEFKKSLASLGVNRLLRNTTFNLNASWIRSEVQIPNDPQFANLDQTRPLQGQSPYVINAGLYYFDEEKGYGVNLGYNVFGPRIFAVGDDLFPSWWEMPRHSLDLQLSKTLWKKFDIKFNAQNLLDARYWLMQDNNRDQSIVLKEDLIQSYRIGSQYTLSASWKFLLK